jgi:hypothetical protein
LEQVFGRVQRVQLRVIGGAGGDVGLIWRPEVGLGVGKWQVQMQDVGRVSSRKISVSLVGVTDVFHGPRAVRVQGVVPAGQLIS